MRRLLKFMNYAAQLMALIDIGKTIKRWATKSNIKKQKERPKVKTQMTSPSKKPPTTQNKKRNRLISQRLRFLAVIPTGPFFYSLLQKFTQQQVISQTFTTQLMRKIL